METSYLKTLELDKIIARAAEGCVCKEARAMLLAIEPQCDPDEVRYALEQTDAINTLLIKNGSPRFGGVEGVSQLAARAVKGGVLLRLIDTAGLHETDDLVEQLGVERSKKAVEDADLILALLDGSTGLPASEGRAEKCLLRWNLPRKAASRGCCC